jgi:hypothetical protein
MVIPVYSPVRPAMIHIEFGKTKPDCASAKRPQNYAVRYQRLIIETRYPRGWQLSDSLLIERR